jgi:CBS domain-containing protein
MLGIRLDDPVSRLIGAPVATVGPTATLREAADAFVANSVGLLVVVDPHQVRGVLSERDLVAAVADDAELTEERVRDRVSYDLVSVEEGASVLDAAAAMAAADVRHLAITRRGVVVGVVSIRDIVAVLLEQGDLDAVSV